MLVPSNATTLSEIPQFLELEEFISRGINIRTSSTEINRFIDMCAHALLAFRRSLNLPTNVSWDIVRMENTTERTVVGAIIRGNKLKSFYDVRFYEGSQIHVDATMCVLSWNNNTVRKCYGYPSFVNLGICPTYMPDNMKDKPIFFKEDILVNYFNERKEYFIKEEDPSVLLKDLEKLFIKVAKYHKEDWVYFRPSDLDNLVHFISTYMTLLNGRSLKGHPPKYRLTEGWVHASIRNIKTDLNNLPLIYAFVKRCFYLLCREGFIL